MFDWIFAFIDKLNFIREPKRGRDAHYVNEVKNDDLQASDKKKRKRRTPEEMKEYRESKKKELLKLSRESSKRNIEGLHNSGVTNFIWRSVGDCRVCSECRKNNGKRFSLKNPPAIGYPGEHECQGEGHCRCYAEPDWKGTPFDMS